MDSKTNGLGLILTEALRFMPFGTVLFLYKVILEYFPIRLY